jgi:DNA-directed RNA polymerase subunit RPC12/RpoP
MTDRGMEIQIRNLRESNRLRLIRFVSDFVLRISEFLVPPGGAVTKIFWVTCPQCQGEFYCHWHELRHKKIKLLCPYCSHQFLDEESPKIVE